MICSGTRHCTLVVKSSHKLFETSYASRPPILHCDLKAKSILIDSRFRAKVADFGLATNKPGLHGTPFWYATSALSALLQIYVSHTDCLLHCTIGWLQSTSWARKNTTLLVISMPSVRMRRTAIVCRSIFHLLNFFLYFPLSLDAT